MLARLLQQPRASGWLLVPRAGTKDHFLKLFFCHLIQCSPFSGQDFLVEKTKRHFGWPAWTNLSGRRHYSNDSQAPADDENVKFSQLIDKFVDRAARLLEERLVERYQ